MTDEIDTEPKSEFKRPKWLKAILTLLSAWHTFLLSFFIYAGIIVSGINFVFKIDGVPGTAGIIIIVVIGLLSLATAFVVVRWQHRLLARQSLRTNYIVLAILIILSLLFLPTPFIYTTM